jgi:ATP-dependent Clp protease ATP-binding subunit ClpB
MDEAKRKGDWQTMSELQYGRLPELEAQLKQADTQTDKDQQASGGKLRLLRTQVGPKKSRKSCRVRLASLFPA